MSKFINPLLIIIIAVVLRLVPHVPNFAPITAMALFGGVYLNKRYALVVPMVVMLISDLFLGLHETLPFVYLSFLISGLIGLYIRERKSPINIAAASVSSSVAFFFISNLGVWLVGNLYPLTLEGLADCFTLAIPFFKNTLLGDLFYTALFFGSYEIIHSLLGSPSLQKTRH